MKKTKLYQWWKSYTNDDYWIIGAAAFVAGILCCIPDSGLKVIGFIIYGIMAIGLTASFLTFKKPTLLCLILAASILAAQAQQASPQQSGNPDNPKAVGCVVGCLVLIVGVIVVYELVRFCDAHLPPPPNQPSTNSVPPFTNSYPSNFLGIYQLNNGPVFAADYRTFTLAIDILPLGLALTPQGYWSPASSDALTFDGWCTAYSRISGSPPFPQPPAPESLQVGYAGGTLSITEVGEPTRTLVLLRSPDMRHWNAVATNVWSARFTRVTAVDINAPQGMAFYKIVQQ